MKKKILLFTFVNLFLASLQFTEAGQPKIPRVGVIFQGGEWNALIDGLRDGLRESGLQEGKQLMLEIRDTKGDLNAVDEVAKRLERDKVDLLYTVATSVSLRAKRATKDIPLVFCAGSDPVALGLVESFAKPGGRLTGVHFLATDLTAKRLEILKDLLPQLRRVITFYNPNNPSAQEAAKLGREAAQGLRIELIERHVASVQELSEGLHALRAKEADAFIMLSDAMVLASVQLILDAARIKKLPTMFWEYNSVEKGGIASYGVSYHEVGRVSAKYVQRVLAGAKPKDLPVEGFRKLELVVNVRAAGELGITIPPNVLARADRVIK